MNLKNRPPIFVPAEHCAEIEKLSKATLMDMVWDMATRLAQAEGDATKIMPEIRNCADIITAYRDREFSK